MSMYLLCKMRSLNQDKGVHKNIWKDCNCKSQWRVRAKRREKGENFLIQRRVFLMLRTLKKNKCLDNFAYEKLYPSGSSPAKIFGSPKTRKPFESNAINIERNLKFIIYTYFI